MKSWSALCLKVNFTYVLPDNADGEKDEAADSPEGTGNACPAAYRMTREISDKKIHDHHYTNGKKENTQKGYQTYRFC